MPSTRKTAAKKPARTKSKTGKSSPKRKSGTPAGPLVNVARKIGTTLGEVAVRTGLVKPGGGEPSGQ
ncbi:MAG TPA: hypothetical protein VMS96_03575 [Terriglobales bacterium]|nr:hypothetical protein [Terriglobales bacterium]